MASLKQAKSIILTPEGIGTEARWERETPWLADLLVAKLGLSRSSTVLDFGCGVGRLAKAIIEKSECSVYGWDTSEAMRALAPSYVGSPFFALAKEPFPKVSAAFAAWVIQHVEDPAEALAKIAEALAPKGKFLLVNNVYRAVPVHAKRGGPFWLNDNAPVEELVLENFRELERGALPCDLAPKPFDATYWALYEVL